MNNKIEIGSAVVECPECGNVLSFRDAQPFCRHCEEVDAQLEELKAEIDSTKRHLSELQKMHVSLTGKRR
jgi:endogenous inhibitor of DNA gyrase (YacG/DUF329 family)